MARIGFGLILAVLIARAGWQALAPQPMTAAPALPFYDWKVCPFGVDGVVITVRPGSVRMDRDLPEQGLKRGDTILTYTNRGEGFSAGWVNMGEADFEGVDRLSRPSVESGLPR